MMILKLQKKYKKFLKKITKGLPKTIRKFIKKEGFIPKPPVETFEFSEDQKRIRKNGE